MINNIATSHKLPLKIILNYASENNDNKCGDSYKWKRLMESSETKHICVFYFGATVAYNILLK